MRKIQKQIAKYLKDISCGCGYRHPKVYLCGMNPYAQKYRCFVVVIEDLELADSLVLTRAYAKTGIKVAVLSPNGLMERDCEEVIRLI